MNSDLNSFQLREVDGKAQYKLESEGADAWRPFNQSSSGYDILEVGIIYFVSSGQGGANLLATKNADGSWTSYNWNTRTGKYLREYYGYYAKNHIKCLVMQNGYYGNSVKVAEYQVDEKIIGQANGFGACVIVLEDLS